MTIRKSKSARRSARRKYYKQTRLSQRLKDEKELGEITEDVGLWLLDMKKYDLKGIDDPIPENITTKLEIRDVKHPFDQKLMRFHFVDVMTKEPLPLDEVLAEINEKYFKEMDVDKEAEAMVSNDWEYRDNNIDEIIDKYKQRTGATADDQFWDSEEYDQLIEKKKAIVREEIENVSRDELLEIYNQYEIWYDLKLMDGDTQIGVIPYYTQHQQIGIGRAKVEEEYQSLGLYNYLRRELVNIADSNKLEILTGASGFDSSDRLTQRGLTKTERDKQLFEYYSSWGEVSGEFGEQQVRKPHD